MEVSKLLFTIVVQGPAIIMPVSGTYINLSSLVKNKDDVNTANIRINKLLLNCNLTEGFIGLKYLFLKLLNHFLQFETVAVPDKYLSIQTWRWGKAKKDEVVSPWQLRSTIPEILDILTTFLNDMTIHSGIIPKIIQQWENFKITGLDAISKSQSDDAISTMNNQMKKLAIIPTISPPIIKMAPTLTVSPPVLALTPIIQPPKVILTPATESIAAKPYRKKAINKGLRMQVWDKYIGVPKQGICLCCGRTQLDRDNFECGHVQSEYSGGNIDVDNLKPVCSTCNGGMSTMNMLDFMKQKRYPVPANWNGIDAKPRYASIECICNYHCHFTSGKKTDYDGHLFRLILNRDGITCNVYIETPKTKRKVNVDYDLITVPKLIRSYIDMDVGYMTNPAVKYQNTQVTVTFSQSLAVYSGKIEHTNGVLVSVPDKYYTHSIKSMDFEDVFIQFQEAMTHL